MQNCRPKLVRSIRGLIQVRFYHLLAVHSLAFFFLWQRVIGIAKFRSIVPLSPHSYQKERVTDKFTSSCKKYVLPCLLVRKFSLLIVILAIVALHCWRPYQYSPSGPMNCRQSQARAVVGRNCYVSFELIRFLQVFQYTATAVHQQKPLQLSRSINW